MMNMQDFNYEVKKADKGIALFVDADDAIKFAKTKKDNYTWIEVWDLKNDRMIYAWCY